MMVNISLMSLTSFVKTMVFKIRHTHTLHQNGVCERKNWTLIGVVLTMFFHSLLPKSYQGEALLTTNHFQNRRPTKTILENKSPYEVWIGIFPPFTYLKIFGCAAYALIPKESRHKLESHSMSAFFLDTLNNPGHIDSKLNPQNKL